MKHLRAKHQTLLATIRAEQALSKRSDAEVAATLADFIAQSGLAQE